MDYMEKAAAVGTSAATRGAQVPKDEGELVVLVKSLQRSSYELRARLQKTGDVICGMRPEKAGGETPDPSNLLALLQRVGSILDDCHQELTRTTSVLGM